MIEMLGIIIWVGLMIILFGAFELMDNEPGALKKIIGGAFVFGIAASIALGLGCLSDLAHIKISN